MIKEKQKLEKHIKKAETEICLKEDGLRQNFS